MRGNKRPTRLAACTVLHDRNLRLADPSRVMRYSRYSVNGILCQAFERLSRKALRTLA